MECQLLLVLLGRIAQKLAKQKSNDRISPTLIPVIVNATIWSLDLILGVGLRKKYYKMFKAAW